VTVRDPRQTPVRKVEAMIKPFTLEAVTAALRDAGVDLTVSNVRGFERGGFVAGLTAPRS